MNFRTTSIYVRVISLALAMAGCATGPSFGPAPEDSEFPGLRRSTTVEWARPLKSGPPRVLIALSPLAVRDSLELVLRVDMDYQLVLFGQTSSEVEDINERLQKTLEGEPDLIVLAGIDFGMISEPTADRIRETTGAGAGLLLAHHHPQAPEWLERFLREVTPVESASPITRGIAAALTPEWQGGLDFVQAGTYGAGRVVELNYPGGKPVYHGLLPELAHPAEAEWAHYETYWSLIAKAALWAADSAPSQWIDRVQEEAVRDEGFEELPPGMTEEEMDEYLASIDARILRSYRLHLNAPADETYEVTAQLRQPGRQWRTQFLPPEKTLSAGDESFLLSVPGVPGEFYLDAWLKDRDKVVDWHSIPTAIDARPFFENLRTGRDVVLPNDTIRVVFELLPSQRTEDGLRRCVVALRATDAYGRRVGYRTDEASGAKRTFTASLDVADLISSRVDLECLMFSQSLRGRQTEELRLLGAGGNKIPLGVRLPGPARSFSVAIASHTSQEYAVRELNGLLAESGVSTVVTRASEDAARFVPDAGLTPVFQLRAHWQPDDIEALAGEGDIPAGAPLPGTLQGLIQEVRSVRLGVADGFLLGGINGFVETYAAVHSSPSVMQEFRDRLWAEFGEPSRLGPEWAERFETWDALSLESIRKAAEGGYYEPWMRFSRHADNVFMRLSTMAQDAVRKEEPLAPVGFCMVAPPDNGPSPMSKESVSAVELAAIPPHPVCIARTSAYRSPDSLAFLFAPGAGSVEEARWWPWHACLHGHSGLWWNIEKGPECVLQSMVQVDPVFSEVLSQSKRIDSGFAELVRMAEPAQASIAVYDSRASEWLHDVLPERRSSLRAVLNVLGELGFATELVAADDTGLDALTAYKCLMLPGVDVLSDAEIARIREFVQGGGVVLADALPGRFDALGRVRDNPPLQNLFREWTGGVESESHETSRANLIDGGFDSEEARAVLESVLRDAGCTRVLDVEPEGAFEGQRFAYRLGAAEFFAVLVSPHQTGREKLRIALPSDKFVYDMLTGLEERKTKRISWRANPGDVALYSALPYRVTAVQAVAPERVLPGNRLKISVRVLTEDSLPGTHLVHVQLRPMGGTPIPWYDKTLVCESGRGETYIPLALDETPGFYKVVVRDVLTGMTAEWPVEIARSLDDAVNVTIKPESQ